MGLSKCFVRRGLFGRWWIVEWFAFMPGSELGGMSGKMAKFRNEDDARLWCKHINVKRGHNPEERLGER